MPAATPEILERETRDFLADVELFLEAEIEETPIDAVGLEVSFGRPLGDEEEPLARAEPVEIALARTHAAHRRPHRSDQRGRPGHVRGARLQDRRILARRLGRGVFAGGRRLQHALYGLAAVELLKTRYKKPKVHRASTTSPATRDARSGSGSLLPLEP